MARRALATIDQLEAALGGSPPDLAQAESLLDRASAIVRAFAGRTWLNDANELVDVPDDIAGVVVSMVERAITNPDGATQQQETVGQYSWGRSYGSSAADRLYLSQWDKLVIKAAVGSSPLSTISTTRGPLETGSTGDGFGVAESNPWALTQQS